MLALWIIMVVIGTFGYSWALWPRLIYSKWNIRAAYWSGLIVGIGAVQIFF